jgi:hypothetical protein
MTMLPVGEQECQHLIHTGHPSTLVGPYLESARAARRRVSWSSLSAHDLTLRCAVVQPMDVLSTPDLANDTTVVAKPVDRGVPAQGGQVSPGQRRMK